MFGDFRTEPPWESNNTRDISPEYTIIAEFPSVTWGWEADCYFWILRDSNGNTVLGSTVHDKFCLSNTEELQKQIAELSGFLDHARKGLAMLQSTTQEVRTMAGLSPAAQAVLDTYGNQDFGIAAITSYERRGIAVALEAVADQVVPANGSRRNNEIRAEILGIAAELRDFLP